MKFAVLGPGGVGGLLAALLARAGNSVVVLASAETARTLAEAGLQVESGRFGNFHVKVGAAEQLDEPVDACLVTVKATHLQEALHRVPADELGGGLIIPFLNGIDHVDVLRGVYAAANVVAATIRIETTKARPGVIRHSSPFAAVELAPSPVNRERVDLIAEQLTAAGVDVRLRDDEPAMLWDKMVVLAPLALVSTHERGNVGALRERRRGDLEALIRELTAVAAAEGVAVDSAAIIKLVDSMPAQMETSMQRDQAAGRPLELDALGGAVLRRAAAHGVPVPVTSRLVADLEARTAPRA